MTLTYRTVFVSDVHLGCRAARAKALNRFLKHLRCERLYLVGDVIDMWRLKSKWHWPESHNRVLRRLLDHSKHGTEVIFLPGNHDEAARQFIGAEFGGIHVRALDVHETLDGRKLLVTHGDQFDIVVRSGRLLPMLGAQGYNLLLAANRPFNAIRQKLGLPYASLSKRVKYSVKRACTHISNFEELLMLDAHNRGLDGVVCGHIHHPAFRPRSLFPQQLVDYYNCGDWMEGSSALVEHLDGRLELIDAEAVVEQHRAQAEEEADEAATDEAQPSLVELIAYGRIFAEAGGSPPVADRTDPADPVVGVIRPATEPGGDRPATPDDAPNRA
ncbi:UDP-2,3-diacylglucosamine diphosphatase [Phycisphaera mikurensis]|uniref:Putative hydrolase n=1 Tax=Phycisphaera mikurensis (strain NBRC 102666 / KCTC 22515 / FYK2301M01) TaxID=1142394 RepID=I0IFZ2_PHYMF|nr:UDP-2,3-diacylglucosamine diphosphatase [Phycisphaera mikurensis]MBB6440434.1 UDP-2,3-diacylglucosamine pyrophosphatase LpxH [Phycisphaera mikurensis]BAM04180.1 putative hydrolase [Phycisphaera mikurensis NBRC 102666]